MNTLNELLIKQIKKHFGDLASVPKNITAFLETISESYDHYDKDEKELENSVKNSSKTITELNKLVHEESKQDCEILFQKLKESLLLLNDENEELFPKDFDYSELSYIADVLKNETHKRRIAEEERAQREAHLNASQHIAKIGSWELDISSLKNIKDNNLLWSEETYKIFGFTPYTTKVTNDLFFSRIPIEDHNIVLNALRTAIDTGKMYDVEHRLMLPDNIEKIVHERGEIVYGVDNKPLKMIGTAQDITEQKAAATNLEKANRELRTLFENMREVFFSIDMEKYELLQMSNACEEVYGYPIEEFKNNSNFWFEIILDEDKPVIYNNEAAMRQGKSFVNEYRIFHKKSGTIRWLGSKITPTLDKEGKLIRLDGITSDITQRKEAELALLDSEHKFRSLIENSSDAIVVINEHGDFTFASNSLYRITGFKPSEIIGNSIIPFLHPAAQNEARQYLSELIDKKETASSIVYKFLKKDGTYIWCEGVAQNLIDQPSVQGIVFNFRDITERKAYTNALKTSNENLRKSNAELDKFVYSVSHDLRAPLSSMLGIVGLLESDITDEATLGDIGLLKSSINKLDGFIQDILDYSRNSRSEIKKEKINFKEILDDTINNLKYMQAGNNNVALNVNINDKEPFYSDKSRISIILNNLISNAIRYSNPEIPAPYVDISIQTTPKGATIVVKDNGIGISKENQPKIFEMFYRASKKSIGSGLGLYILKETTEKLKGSIHLESELNRGTTFHIVIPVLS